MKGFVHVIEILLVVVLVFFVFAQFASIPSVSDDWPRTKLGLMTGDILHSFERKGVDWFNKTELENEFNKTLSENIMYSLLLENVIKPEIKIGCLCDGGQMDILNDILKPGWFVINDKRITFEIIQVFDVDGLFSLDFDVALVYGYEDFTPNFYSLRNFLNYDRGIVEIFDPPKTDDVQKEIFGLDSGETTSGNFNITFSDLGMGKGKELDMIHDYFSHIPIFYDPFENLEQWSVKSGFAENPKDMGNPEPSVKLTGNSCYSGNTFMYTAYYKSFQREEIDFDVYLEDGASLFVGFRKYFASLSANESIGYDSFYDQSMNPIGWNSSHLTEAGKWNHVKIVVKGGGLTLYSNGEKVATAPASVGSPSNISISNRCGEAWVDNMRIMYEEDHEFGNFLDNENTVQSQDYEEKILLKQKGTGLPACIINYNIEGVGSGRTAWLSNNSNYDPDYKTLVKSLISWAAGDKYRIIKADIKRPISSYIYKPLNKDMFQNVKVILEISYLY